VNFDAFIASLLPARENTAKNSSSKRSKISGARQGGGDRRRGCTKPISAARAFSDSDRV
jgi:hypothetical protein